MPLAPKVKLYSKPFPIFDEYGVQGEIDKVNKTLARVETVKSFTSLATARLPQLALQLVDARAGACTHEHAVRLEAAQQQTPPEDEPVSQPGGLNETE